MFVYTFKQTIKYKDKFRQAVYIVRKYLFNNSISVSSFFKFRMLLIHEFGCQNTQTFRDQRWISNFLKQIFILEMKVSPQDIFYSQILG